MVYRVSDTLNKYITQSGSPVSMKDKVPPLRRKIYCDWTRVNDYIKAGRLLSNSYGGQKVRNLALHLWLFIRLWIDK